MPNPHVEEFNTSIQGARYAAKEHVYSVLLTVVLSTFFRPRLNLPRSRLAPPKRKKIMQEALPSKLGCRFWPSSLPAHITDAYLIQARQAENDDVKGKRPKGHAVEKQAQPETKPRQVEGGHHDHHQSFTHAVDGVLHLRVSQQVAFLFSRFEAVRRKEGTRNVTGHEKVFG